MLRQDVRIVSAHDLRCLAGIDLGHISRYFIRWLEEGADPPNTLTVDYLRVARPGEPPYTNNTALALGTDRKIRTSSAKVEEKTSRKSSTDSGRYVRPSVINAAIAMDLTCARDHKWRLVSMAINRQECNCINQVRRGAGDVLRLYPISPLAHVPRTRTETGFVQSCGDRLLLMMHCAHERRFCQSQTILSAFFNRAACLEWAPHDLK